jgi:hypothetical protein
MPRNTIFTDTLSKYAAVDTIMPHTNLNKDLLCGILASNCNRKSFPKKKKFLLIDHNWLQDFKLAF